MARTANRYLKTQLDRESKERIYQAGNYLRLSVDSDYTGSDSLENQRKLAKEYVDKVPDLMIAKEYIDDGRTGTNFERPAFMRMIADLKHKVIDCIIVKDLSRFGRECIEAGNYIEKVFPFLGVRFISIVDRYDSADPECDKELLLISLKNLMHEMYAKDISKKVGSTFRIKQEKGMFYRSATLPYGYKMDQDNKNYCIDEPAAKIVRQIFSLYYKEASKYAVCQYLYKNRILTPGQYRKAGRIYQEQEEVLRSWHLSTIDRILRNPVYIGNILRHRTEQSFFEGKKSVKVPEEEMVLIVKNHQPIISEALFNEVQKKLEQVKTEYIGFRSNSALKKETLVFETNIFQGKIFCGNCGAVMTRAVKYRMVDGREERYKSFQCSAHRSISGCCDSKGIEEKLLCDILYTTIQKHLSLIKGLKTLIDKDIRYSFEGRLKKIEGEKQRSINHHAMLEQEYMREYEQQVLGQQVFRQNMSKQDVPERCASDELEANRFQSFRQSYLERVQFCKNQLKQLEEEEKKVKKYRISIKKMFTTWMNQDGRQELTEDMVQCCIDRIEVFQGNRIEVKLRYQDCFAMLEEWTQGGV